jgi:putative peptidoglycan lipid II flippase
MIFSGVVICPALGDTPEKQVWGWVIGALFGSVLEIAIQWIPAAKSGFSFKPVIDLAEEGMKRIMKLMAPSVVAQSVTQFNLLVNTVLASFLVQGAVTYLYYGNRLMQLPFGVFGVAIATVSFPYIAQCVSRGDREGLCSTIHSSLKQAFFIVIPASAGIIALSGPINALLFRYGRFTAEDAAATAVVSIVYSSAIFAFSGIKILTQVFYALDKAAAAVKISVAAVVLNIILSIALMFPFNYLGLAAATAISGIVQFVLLYIYVEKYAGNIMTKQLAMFSLKVTAASLVMAALVAVLYGSLSHAIGAQESRVMNGVLVFGSITAGALIYFISVKFMKLSEADSFLSMIRNKIRK